MLVFLVINNIELEYLQEGLTDIVLQIAASEKNYADLDVPFLFRNYFCRKGQSR